MQIVAKSWHKTFMILPLNPAKEDEALEFQGNEPMEYVIDLSEDEVTEMLKKYKELNANEFWHYLMNFLDNLMKEEAEEIRVEFSENYGFPIDNIWEVNIYVNSITVNGAEIILSPHSEFDEQLLVKALLKEVA